MAHVEDKPDDLANTAGRQGTIGKVVPGIRRVCEGAALLVLVFMTCLTCADIVARYFLNSPIRGAFELTEISLAILVFLSLPVAAAADSHIKVDLIPGFGNGLFAAIVKGISFLITLGIFVVLAVQIGRHTLKIKSYEQVTNSLEIPLYLIGFVAAFCCVLCVLVILLNAVTSKQDSQS